MNNRGQASMVAPGACFWKQDGIKRGSTPSPESIERESSSDPGQKPTSLLRILLQVVLADRLEVV